MTCTTPYNADFDGDEMNLHLLQTHQSRADALGLMSVAYNIITPQANRPVMGIVQDSLLSSYMLTSPGVTLDKGEMCNMCMWVEGATLPEPDLPGPLWTGLQCMSLLFPKDFNWRDTIYQGKLLKGPLGKKALDVRTALSFTDCIMIMGQTAHVNSLMSYSVSITYGFLSRILHWYWRHAYH